MKKTLVLFAARIVIFIFKNILILQELCQGERGDIF